jgi:acyl-CoA hydrolase
MCVNTAIEVDLYGQVNAEFINGHQYSGSGGQFAFVKGASFSKGGKSFIGPKSAAKKGGFRESCHGGRWRRIRGWMWNIL